MTDAGKAVDWQHWLDRWDAQQAGYLPRREERFATMLDLVEAVAGAAPRVLDLAAGFPEIAVVWSDLDDRVLAAVR